MLTSVNDDLYAEGLTDIDRRTIGDGDSNASTWVEWPFAPIRFEGMIKHSMASALHRYRHYPDSLRSARRVADRQRRYRVRRPADSSVTELQLVDPSAVQQLKGVRGTALSRRISGKDGLASNRKAAKAKAKKGPGVIIDPATGRELKETTP